MAGQLWATGTLGGNLAQPYLTKWLRTVSQPLMRFRQVCDIKEAIGKHQGDTFNWDIIADIASAGGTLAETDTVPQTNFTVTKGTLSVTEYANSIPFTRKLLELSQHELKGIVRTSLANDMAKVLDKAVFAVMQGSPLVYQASAGTDTSNVVLYTDGTGTQTNEVPLSYNHVVEIVDSMKERNIPAYDGTDYLCIGHPSTFSNIRHGLIGVGQYTDTGYNKILNGEIGRFNGVRFIEQTNVDKLTPTNAAAKSWACFIGGEAVIEAISVPEEVIMKEITDFGRSLGLAWYCILGYGLGWTAAAQSRIAWWWPNASAVSSLTP
jgi:N4-gp56 family major capsid protein